MSSDPPNPSTISLLSTDTVTSTTPLSASQRPPQKDYSAALANLQSRYGLSGSPHTNTPFAKPSSTIPKSQKSSSSTSHPTPAFPAPSSGTLTVPETSRSASVPSLGAVSSSSTLPSTSSTGSDKDSKPKKKKSLFSFKKK